MTSSDLQKLLGVSSAATANSWADELNNLSNLPVQRNSRGARVFSEQQLEIIAQAFDLQKSGIAPTRAEALRMILEPMGLLFVESESNPDLSSSSQTLGLEIDSKIESIDISASPQEVGSPVESQPILEPVNVPPVELEPIQSINSRFSSMRSNLLEWLEHYTYKASLLTHMLQRKIKMFLYRLRRVLWSIFSVRDNPLWISIPLERRRALVRFFSTLNHVMLMSCGFVGLLLLSGYLVSLFVDWLKLPPVLLVNWQQFLSIYLASLIVPIVMFFYLPNDI